MNKDKSLCLEQNTEALRYHMFKRTACWWDFICF